MKIIYSVSGNTIGQMEEHIKANGLLIKCTGKDSLLGMMVKYTKENI